MEFAKAPSSITERIWDCVIGVDQTGAAVAGGARAKDLTATIINLRDRKIEVGVSIPTLGESTLRALMPGANHRLLVVDSVLGLPEIFETDFFDLMDCARDYTLEGKRFGAAVAESFFNRYLKSLPNYQAASRDPKFLRQILPRRRTEIEFSANSVFLSRPYQRNIACGSYRVLRDLGGDPPQGLVAWHDLLQPIVSRHPAGPDASSCDLVRSDGAITLIAEGYPSASWRSILGMSVRDVKGLQARKPEFVQRTGLIDFVGLEDTRKIWNPDQADSLVLALEGLRWIRSRHPLAPLFETASTQKEGAIFCFHS